MIPAIDAWADLLLDACCVINLAATGRMADILTAFSTRFSVADRVVDKATYLLAEGDGAVTRPREPIDLQPLIHSGLLTPVRLDTDAEIRAFVSFAAGLDDGEAITCAIAMLRGYALATDDRKVLGVMQAADPTAHIVTTAAIIKAWAEKAAMPPADVRQTLLAIQRRAHFFPASRDPLHEWWMTMTEPPSSE